MATSGSTDYGLTASVAMEEALRAIGVTGTIPTAQATSNLRTLNYMVKAWSTFGCVGWARKTASKALTSGVASYDVTPRPIRVLSAYYRDSAGNDTPLTILSKWDYDSLSDKDAAGRPTGLYYDQDRTTGTLYLWPVPDESLTLYYAYHRPLEDLDSTTNDMDFPSEWFEAIKLQLAVRLALPYGRPVSQELFQQAERALSEAKGYGNESGSFYFEPEVG